MKILKESLFQNKKFLIISTILSIPIGATFGTFTGLIATTFIPQECNEEGCHNAFEWNGKIGYEATGYLGFWIGMIIIPIVWILILLILKKKNKK